MIWIRFDFISFDFHSRYRGKMNWHSNETRHVMRWNRNWAQWQRNKNDKSRFSFDWSTEKFTKRCSCRWRCRSGEQHFRDEFHEHRNFPQFMSVNEFIVFVADVFLSWSFANLLFAIHALVDDVANGFLFAIPPSFSPKPNEIEIKKVEADCLTHISPLVLAC